MDTKHLKDSILQYAMQGKLVLQDPNDEPAIELLKRIKGEKELLIAQKVIKKEKALPEISDEEIPFEIPETWEWVRLQDVCVLTSGINANSFITTEGTIPYIKVSDMNLSENEKIVTRSTNYVDKSLLSKVINKKSIIFPKRGGAILTNKKRLTEGALILDPNIMAITPFNEGLLEYIYLWFLGVDFRNIITGTSVPQINNKDIYPLLIPLPPVEEQARIIEKIKILFDNLAKYEAASKELLRKRTEFPVKLKKSILQYAMQGKLVEQDSADEPAGKLIERIKLKKEELIMNKIIKKEKALPEITDEEIPFEIPETWEWIRLGEIANITSGATPLKSNSSYYLDGNIPWCTSTVTGLEIVNEPNVYITDLALKECNLKVYPKGTLLMAMYGQGKTRGQVTELGIDSAINQACAAIELYNDTITTTGYIKLALKFVYNTIRQKAAGGAQPNLNQGKVKEILIPLPPVHEQVKIVAKYNKYEEQVRLLLSK
ncbi:restriction endonuclease subunit S [Bacillus mycoides]|uniref:restriction endonuclease subunit S n=1 Tax=Bacillus mycoides TaxID=1405 RepID=UPI00103CCC0B|nr:restriction endonuclease subunit S [Bacillus mycoides]TBX83309.1 restriction endonuclease subunit S [Bacillus mycoides]